VGGRCRRGEQAPPVPPIWGGYGGRARKRTPPAALPPTMRLFVDAALIFDYVHKLNKKLVSAVDAAAAHHRFYYTETTRAEYERNERVFGDGAPKTIPSLFNFINTNISNNKRSMFMNWVRFRLFLSGREMLLYKNYIMVVAECCCAAAHLEIQTSEVAIALIMSSARFLSHIIDRHERILNDCIKQYGFDSLRIVMSSSEFTSLFNTKLRNAF
jgi:hypothetical protein